MTADECSELTRLRRESKQLRWSAIFFLKRQPSCPRNRRRAARIFRLMSANQAKFPITTMARVLSVSEAGFYAWSQRSALAHAQTNPALLERVRTVHAISLEPYGAPCIHAELQRGEKHGRKRIALLMRDAGLVGAGRRRQDPVTTRRDKDAQPAPDPVASVFTAAALVSSGLVVPTSTGFMYLAVMLDAWSRKIVG